MNTKLRLLRRLWPLVCGLVVGGLLGGLTRSWAIGALAGGVAWVFFAAVLHGNGEPDANYEPNRVINPAEVPDPADLDQQVALHAYGSVGVGSYAHLYEQLGSDEPRTQ